MIVHNIITVHKIKAKSFGGKTYSSINISTPLAQNSAQRIKQCLGKVVIFGVCSAQDSPFHSVGIDFVATTL